MSSAIFNTIKALEKARLHFYVERTRPDTLRLNGTLVGERIEIEVFEDEHLEISRFRGDESVEGGEELLRQILNALILSRSAARAGRKSSAGQGR